MKEIKQSKVLISMIISLSLMDLIPPSPPPPLKLRYADGNDLVKSQWTGNQTVIPLSARGLGVACCRRPD